MSYKLLRLSIALLLVGPVATAQNVFPGKEKLNKKEYFGLNMNSSIPQRHLEAFWKDYLQSFGKVHSRRGVISVDRARVASISSQPVEMLSQVKTVRNLNHVFLAVKVGDRFVANFTDSTYEATANFLREFADYAALRDELRLAEEYYDVANKNHQALERDSDRIVKEIERTQRRLEELYREQETNVNDLAGSVIDLQQKQDALEAARARVPKR